MISKTLLVRVAGALASPTRLVESKEITKTQNDNAKAKIVIPNPADDEEVSETTIQASGDRFIQEHPEGWSFEDESELRNNLAEDGLDI